MLDLILTLICHTLSVSGSIQYCSIERCLNNALTPALSNNQVRKFVIRREVQPKGEGKKPYTKAPRIQRLVTPQRLQHKRHRMALKRRQAEASKDAAVSPFLPIYALLHLYYLRPPTIYLYGHGVHKIYTCKANLYRQNEYASILAKRVNEEKAKKTELRSKSILYPSSTWQDRTEADM